MLFWLICGALVILVAGSILAPFWLGRGVAEDDPAAYDLQVYRDQLREVDRDLQRGVIGADDAAQLRTEIGRKVLDADRRMGGADDAGHPGLDPPSRLGRRLGGGRGANDQCGEQRGKEANHLGVGKAACKFFSASPSALEKLAVSGQTATLPCSR